MVFSRDDRILTRELREIKAMWLLKEFPLKSWSLADLSRLIKSIAFTGSSDRKISSGKPRSARTDEIMM